MIGSVYGLKLSYSLGGNADETKLLPEFAAQLERTGAELARVTRHVAPYLFPAMEKEVSKQFDAEGGGPVAGKWPALSKAYAKWKRAHWPGRPILVRTGRLRRTLTTQGEGAVRAVGDDVLTYGTAGVPYATAHQMGGEHLPARPPVDFRDGFTGELQRALRLGVRDAFKAAKAADLAAGSDI